MFCMQNTQLLHTTLKFDFACCGACMMCLAVEQMTGNEQPLTSPLQYTFTYLKGVHVFNLFNQISNFSKKATNQVFISLKLES